MKPFVWKVYEGVGEIVKNAPEKYQYFLYAEFEPDKKMKETDRGWTDGRMYKSGYDATMRMEVEFRRVNYAKLEVGGNSFGPRNLFRPDKKTFELWKAQEDLIRKAWT